MGFLANYAWRGNIRELQNEIERGVVLWQSSVLTLGPDLLPQSPNPPSLTQQLAASEPVRTSADRSFASTCPAAATSLSLEELERQHWFQWRGSDSKDQHAMMTVRMITIQAARNQAGVADSSTYVSWGRRLPLESAGKCAEGQRERHGRVAGYDRWSG